MAKRRWIHYTILACLTVVSHVVLPWSQRSTWGPFAQWRLFVDLQGAHYYDLRHRAQDQDRFLTDHSLPPPQQFDENHSALWHAVQDCGRSEQVPPCSKLPQIRKILRENGSELISLCRIMAPLPQYLLLASDKKKEVCVDVLR